MATTKIQDILVSNLALNNGQIAGLPKNPRFIKDADFENLKQSLIDDPEFLPLNPLLVYKVDNSFVIIGGNMRYRAAKELKIKELPCIVAPENTTPEKLRSFLLKHNSSFGKWDYDLLANDWDASEIFKANIDIPNLDFGDDFSNKNKEIDTDNFSDKMFFKLEYNETDYNRIKDQLADIGATPEAALFKFLFPNEKF